MTRTATVFLLALVYHVASSHAEVLETEDAIDDLSSSRVRAARSFGPTEWAAIIGAGALGSVALTTLAVHRRGRLATEAAGSSPPDAASVAKVERDPVAAARESESDRIAPRWSFYGISETDSRVFLELRNTGRSAAHRVRTLGLARGGGAFPAELDPAAVGETIVAAGDVFTIALPGRPARAGFHVRYDDELGFTWWCLVEYRARTCPPVSLGRVEREDPSA